MEISKDMLLSLIHISAVLLQPFFCSRFSVTVFLQQALPAVRSSCYPLQASTKLLNILADTVSVFHIYSGCH